MKRRYLILAALMLVGLLTWFFAPPVVLFDNYTLREIGMGLFVLSFYLSFLTIVAVLSHKK